MTTDVESLRAAFVDGLGEPDRALDPAWLAAFHDVPRDVFVPFYFTPLSDRPGWRLIEPPAPEWISSVWSNKPLITQLNGNDALADLARQGQPVKGVSTSSSSAPSLMALMLQALDVHNEHQVLEIGTGTGYNAALLCHRLGSENVTSVDVDAAVVDRARNRLGKLGYEPHLVATDGVQGLPDRAPYDRIIATVAVPAVPPAWIEQVRDGGKILLPLDLRNCGGLMALLSVHNNRAEDHFLPDYGGFMPVRQERDDAAIKAFRGTSDNEGVSRSTDLAPEIITDSASPFEFFAALMIGGWNFMGFTPSNGGPAETWIARADGSWACHTVDENGMHLVRQGGPTLIWDRVEHAHALWLQFGRPARERFGITATQDDQFVWLDEPTGEHRWPLQSAKAAPPA